MPIEQYIAYLMSEPGSSSCVKASEVLEISHDKVNRLLNQTDNARYYAMWEPDNSETLTLERETFKKVKTEHWNVEKLSPLIKQTCQAERFWIRTKAAINTHLFSALRAAQQLLLMANIK